MEPASLALAVIAFLLVFFAIKAGFVGMAVLFEIFWPDAASYIYDIYKERKRKCFLFGALNAIGLPIVAVLLMVTEVLALPGLMVLVFLWALVAAAYGPVYRDFGARCLDPEKSPSPLRLVLVGGLAAESAFLLPLLGQLLSLGFLLRGLGAVVIVLLARGRRPATIAPEDPSAPLPD